MHGASPSQILIPAGENATISCSAYGNTQEMTGTISKSGERVSSEEERKEGNLFEVSTNVTSEGTYVCTIESRKEKVESATIVKHFKCKRISIPKKCFLEENFPLFPHILIRCRYPYTASWQKFYQI